MTSADSRQTVYSAALSRFSRASQDKTCRFASGFLPTSRYRDAVAFGFFDSSLSAAHWGLSPRLHVMPDVPQEEGAAKSLPLQMRLRRTTSLVRRLAQIILTVILDLAGALF